MRKIVLVSSVLTLGSASRAFADGGYGGSGGGALIGLIVLALFVVGLIVFLRRAGRRSE